MHPRDPFGRIMQDHFLKLNSTLHALRQYPDTAAQTRRFLDKASILIIHTYYLLWSTRRYLISVFWSSGLGAVCVSGYEWLLSRAGPGGGELQSGESGAFWWVWGQLLKCVLLSLVLKSYFLVIILNRMILYISVYPQEWHQKCSHYFILTASRGSLMEQASLPTHTPGIILFSSHTNTNLTLEKKHVYQTVKVTLHPLSFLQDVQRHTE